MDRTPAPCAWHFYYKMFVIKVGLTQKVKFSSVLVTALDSYILIITNPDSCALWSGPHYALYFTFSQKLHFAQRHACRVYGFTVYPS